MSQQVARTGLDVAADRSRLAPFLRSNYSEATIRSEVQSWLHYNETSEVDQAYFSSATNDFYAPEMDDLRNAMLVAGREYAEQFKETSDRLRAEMLGSDFAQLVGTCPQDQEIAAEIRAREQAYADAMAAEFPFTEPSAEQYFANTARPQITYIILSDQETYVFSGRAAIKVDYELKLNPSVVNQDSFIPPTQEFKEGLRVNYDFRGHMEGARDYFRNLVARQVP